MQKEECLTASQFFQLGQSQAASLPKSITHLELGPSLKR